MERGEEVFERLDGDRDPARAVVGGGDPSGRDLVIYNVTNVVSAAVWAVGIGLAAYYAGPPVLDWVSDLGWVSVIGIVLLVPSASRSR